MVGLHPLLQELYYDDNMERYAIIFLRLHCFFFAYTVIFLPSFSLTVVECQSDSCHIYQSDSYEVTSGVKCPVTDVTYQSDNCQMPSDSCQKYNGQMKSKVVTCQFLQCTFRKFTAI